VNLSIHRIRKDHDRGTRRARRTPDRRRWSRSASDHAMCEQLRFDREAIARLENEGGPTSPVLPEQSRELPMICNPTVGDAIY
jgi:hypothetical protein